MRGRGRHLRRFVPRGDAIHRGLKYGLEERQLHRMPFQKTSECADGWNGLGATLEEQLRDGLPDGAGGYIDLCVYSTLEQEWAERVKDKMEERMNRMVAA